MKLHLVRLVLKANQMYTGKKVPYFEDFQRELHAIFLTEGLEDNWGRMKILYAT